MSSIVNKIKEVVHSDKDKTHTEGTHTGTHHTGTHHAGTTGTTGTGVTTGTGAAAGGPGPAPNTAGHHQSDLLNKADPRVDSDLDGSRNLGATSATKTAGYDNSGVTGSGQYGSTTGTGQYGSSNTATGYNDPEGVHGPHSSRLANAADPRVDSDRDHRGAPGGAGYTGNDTYGSNTYTGTSGTGLTGAGATGTGVHTGEHAHGHHHGHHHGQHGQQGLQTGTGPAPNTAGPHSSDVLNKVDPRVDSDLDGSKTVGGNKTFQSSGTNSGINRDPTDASQVPPSVLRRHVGDPSIEHDDHLHNRERRNSQATHQEKFSGI